MTTDDAVRQAVEIAIGRHLARRGAGRPDPAPPVRHASHQRFTLPRDTTGSPSCLIEPTVVCTHCGYCLSLGH